jgi:NAD-dependent deacetylase
MMVSSKEATMADEAVLDRVAEAMQRSDCTVALTGAGASVDSGLPDFRSPGGIWDRYNVVEYAYLDAFLTHPEKVWVFIRELIEAYGDARPNEGHRALAALEAAGRLAGVVTQNIDGLHQAAGSRHVVEFHGSLRRLVCLTCRRRFEFDAARRAAMPCRCPECRRLLKPDFIFFGEAIPVEALMESFALARRCDVLLVAGTSAEVAPASMIPYEAKDCGALIVEVNLQPTLLTRSLTDCFLEGPFAEVMPRLARRVTG